MNAAFYLLFAGCLCFASAGTLLIFKLRDSEATNMALIMAAVDRDEHYAAQTRAIAKLREYLRTIATRPQPDPSAIASVPDDH